MGKAILAVILGATVVIVAGCASGYNPTPDPLDAVRVESTRQAVALQATATALDLQKQALGVEREALDLERARERAEAVDQSMSAFLAALPWVVLLVGLGAVVIVAYLMLPVAVARFGLVRRRPEEGEPVMLLGRDRLSLPLRSAGPYLDLRRGAESAPLLAADAEAQRQATMRQQAANLTLANQVGEVVKAQHGGGDVTLVLPEDRRRAAPALAAPSPVRVLEQPSPEVAGWIQDTERALLPEVVNDDTSD
ncbi:MAG TPA: hypothetical protein VMY80_00800 [Anaerolineae bacterium]|nr:hypothetical protein [Anaerolineae bacterium]